MQPSENWKLHQLESGYESCVSPRKLCSLCTLDVAMEAYGQDRRLECGCGDLGTRTKGLLPDSRNRMYQDTPPCLRLLVEEGSSQCLLHRISKLLRACLPSFPFMNSSFAWSLSAGSLCNVSCGSLHIICLFRSWVIGLSGATYGWRGLCHYLWF